MSSSNETYVMVENFYKFYGGVLLFVGVPANLLSGFIMGTDTSNRPTTRILMVLLALTDTLVLLTAVMRYWVLEIFNGIDVRTFHWFGCKFHTYVMSVSSDYAVGALCSLAVERFLVVAFPHKSELVTKTSVICGMFGLFVGVALKNSVNFWFMGLLTPGRNGTNLRREVNETKNAQAVAIKFHCTKKPSMYESVKMFSKFDYITYAVLPYCILFSCNVYIFAVLRKQRRLFAANRQAAGIKLQQQSKTKQAANNRRKRKPENVIKVLTALTIIHVVTTLPGTTLVLISTYFNIDKSFTPAQNAQFMVIRTGLLLLMFTNNATTFFAYLKSSTTFRERLCKMFYPCPSFLHRLGKSREPLGRERKSMLACPDSERETTRQIEPLNSHPHIPLPFPQPPANSLEPNSTTNNNQRQQVVFANVTLPNSTATCHLATTAADGENGKQNATSTSFVTATVLPSIDRNNGGSCCDFV